MATKLTGSASPWLQLLQNIAYGFRRGAIKGEEEEAKTYLYVKRLLAMKTTHHSL